MATMLLNRCWDVQGTWYAPEKFLQEFKSVVLTELWNTTSSAGDWDGYFVQKVGGKYCFIHFYQENIAWTPYFRLTTGDKPFAECDHKPTRQEAQEIMTAWYNAAMERIGSLKIAS